MQRKSQRKLAAAVAVASSALLGGAPAATAQTYQPLVLLPSAGTPMTAPVGGGATSGTVGGHFMLGRDIVIDQLGFYDYGGDGLLDSHQVGIWSTAGVNGNFKGALLGSVTVDAGTSGTLVDGYRWVSLSTPITLRADTYYAIGATVPHATGNDPFMPLSSSTYNPLLTQTWSATTRLGRYVMNSSTAANPNPPVQPVMTEPGQFASTTITNAMYGIANFRSLVAPNTWVGGAGANWSAGGNWQGGAAPAFASGLQQLTFGAASGATSNNDVSGASLRGIEFAPAAPAMTVTGNAFQTIGGIANYSANTQTFGNAGVTLYADQSVAARAGSIVFNTPVNVGGGATFPDPFAPNPTVNLLGLKQITFNQSVSGNANLIVGGPNSNPTVTFGTDNSFTGNLTVSTGTLKISTSGALGDPGMPDALGTLVGGTTIGAAGNAFASLELSGGINSPEMFAMASRNLLFNYAPHVRNTGGNNTLSGMIFLPGAGGSHMFRSDAGKLTLTGGLGLTGTAAHLIYLVGKGDGEINPAYSILEGSGSNKIGISKQGTGTWTISSAGDSATPNNWTNGVNALGGRLVIDYANETRDIINGANNVLTLYGGTVVVSGNPNQPIDQVVKSTSISSGLGQVEPVNVNGQPVTVRLNAISRTAGGTLNIKGDGAVTTTTGNNASGILGPWAVYRGTDWASNLAGTGEGTIGAAASGAYSPNTWGAGLNTDVTASATITDQHTGTMRFNTPGAHTLTLAGRNSTGAVLVTNNVGNNPTTLTGGTLTAPAGTGTTELILHSWNTAGANSGIVVDSTIADVTATNKTSLVTSGPGTVTLNAANTYTGPTSVGYGTLRIGHADAVKNSTVIVWSSNATLALDTDATVGGLQGYGTVDMGTHDLTFGSAGTGNDNFFGDLLGSGTLTIARTATRAGLVMFGGGGTFSGPINVTAGIYYAKSKEAFGTAAAGVSVASGAELHFQDNMDLDEPLTIAGNGSFTGTTAGALRLLDTHTVTSRGPLTLSESAAIRLGYASNFLQTGNVTGANGNETLTLNGEPHSAGTIDSVIALGTGGLTVNAGNWFLKGANTYTGATSVTGGILTVNSLGTVGGAPSNLGQPTEENKNISFGTAYAQLVYTGAGETTSRGMTLGNANAAFFNSGSGAVTFTGDVTVPETRIFALGGSGNITLGGALTGGGSINVTHGGTVTLAGPAAIANAAVEHGTLRFDSASDQSVASFSTASGNGKIQKAGTGTLTATAVRFPSVNVEGGTLKIAPSGGVAAGVSNIRSLTLSGDGRLDLTDNKLVTITPVGTATTVSGNTRLYDGLQSLVQKAKNGDAWDGPGLTSSIAATEGGLTTIGIANGAQAKGGIGETETALWGGQTITGSSILAMYTYAGDANLDGAITGDDYSAIDFGILFEGMDGYANGDFNYDGYVTGDDYSVIDLNILLQGPQIPTGGSVSASASALSGVTAVPEPSACGFALLGAAAAVTRRRRRPAQ